MVDSVFCCHRRGGSLRAGKSCLPLEIIAFAEEEGVRSNPRSSAAAPLPGASI